MESLTSFRPKRNKSFIYKNLKLSIFEDNNRDNQNISFKSKYTQSDSTTTEEFQKSNNTLNSVSHKKKELPNININNINKGKNIIFKYSIRNKSSKNRKVDLRKLTFKNNKKISLKFNNNKQFRKDIFNNVDFQAKKNVHKIILLKGAPPEDSFLHDYKFKLSKTDVIINKDICTYKCPHVLINHLVFPKKINVNNNVRYIPLSITNRIRGKNLTVLYYRPRK